MKRYPNVSDLDQRVAAAVDMLPRPVRARALSSALSEPVEAVERSLRRLHKWGFLAFTVRRGWYVVCDIEKPGEDDGEKKDS